LSRLALYDQKDAFIKWLTAEEARENKVKLYQLGGFPNIIGGIDGTHIRIQAPYEDEASFVNRKGCHIINVQAVCDANGKCAFLFTF